MLVAIETYLGQHEAGDRARCERIVDLWALGVKASHGTRAARNLPGSDGRSLRRAVVKLDPDSPLSASHSRAQVLAGNPSISVAGPGVGAVCFDPGLLRPEGEGVVLKVLAAAGRRGTRPPFGEGIGQ